MKEKRIHPAYLVLLGVILIRGLCNGGVNMTSGLFLTPVAEELGVGIGTLSIYFSISSLVMVLFLPTAGRLLARYDARWMAVLGAALQALSFSAFGLMGRVWGWYLLCVPQAMGAAITVNLLGPILTGRWFSGSLGTPVGIMLSCGSLLGAVLQPLTSFLIARRGWRAGYLIMGLLVFLLSALSALALIRNRPQDQGLQPYRTKGPKNRPREGPTELDPKKALRSAAFFLLLFFMVLMTGVGVFSQHVAAYGASLGYSLEQTGAALSLYSLGSALGAVILGIFSDRIGSLRTCYGVIFMGGAAVLAFLWGRPYPVFALAAFGYGLMNVGVTVLSPALTAGFFGQNNFEALFSKVSMGAPLAAILLMPAYGFLYDATGSYQLVLVFLLLLLALSALCIGLGWRKREI